MVLNTIAINIMLSLCFTCPIAANILKFICNKKLKDIKSTEYFKIVQDVINLSQNNIVDIISQNTKNNIENTIEKLKKFLVKICLTIFIFSISFLACISEKIGNINQKIGQIIIKGIDIILK